jgi:hypothetical protein
VTLKVEVVPTCPDGGKGELGGADFGGRMPLVMLDAILVPPLRGTGIFVLEVSEAGDCGRSFGVFPNLPNGFGFAVAFVESSVNE